MSRPALLLVSALLLVMPSPAAVGAEPVLRLWYEKPASAWVEALPVGNGRLGAMVFGDPRNERLALNEDTLWSGGPKDWNNPDAKGWLPKVREAVFARRYVEADTLAQKMQGPLLDFEVAPAPSPRTCRGSGTRRSARRGARTGR